MSGASLLFLAKMRSGATQSLLHQYFIETIRRVVPYAYEPPVRTAGNKHMITRRRLISLVAVLPIALSFSISHATAEQAFTAAALEAAQKAGKSILVDVAASWCPTCHAQKPIIDGLAKSEKFKDFVFLKVDFDSQKGELRQLNARMQSTLIVFKGANEVGRSVGDTNPESIEALLAKAL